MFVYAFEVDFRSRVAASLASGSTGDPQRQLLALCAIRGIDRNFIAREVLRRGTIDDLLAGRSPEGSDAARHACRLIEDARTNEAARLDRVDEQLQNADRAGATTHHGAR